MCSIVYHNWKISYGDIGRCAHPIAVLAGYVSQLRRYHRDSGYTVVNDAVNYINDATKKIINQIKSHDQL